HGDPDDNEFTVPGLAELADDRVADRETLLGSLDRGLGRLADDHRVADLGRYQKQAIRLLASAETRRAFDLRTEPVRIRERYGRNKYAQSLLLARRLVEAGVRLVTVYWGGRVNNPVPYWDTHVNNN